MMNDPKDSVVFTLEEHNNQTPTYENRKPNLENSLNQIRSRYRRTEEILASHRARLAGETSPILSELPKNNHDLTPTDNIDNTANQNNEQDFRLPEIEMPPPREYSLDQIPDELFDNAPEADGVFVGQFPEAPKPPTPESPPINEIKQKQQGVLSKFFKRYQTTADTHTHQKKPEPVSSTDTPQPENEQNHDNINIPLPPTENPPPNENEQIYAQQAYLHYLEREHNQRVAQRAISEDDIAILMQEDWLAAQQALKIEGTSPSQTLHLQADTQNPPQYHLNQYGHENRPALTVHVYDLPDLPSTRKIRVWSEQELLAELQRQLRPHLSQAVAGLMHHVLQKKLANLSYDLQMMLNEETPRLVEDILEHNVANILREMKERL